MLNDLIRSYLADRSTYLRSSATTNLCGKSVSPLQTSEKLMMDLLFDIVFRPDDDMPICQGQITVLENKIVLITKQRMLPELR